MRGWRGCNSAIWRLDLIYPVKGMAIAYDFFVIPDLIRDPTASSAFKSSKGHLGRYLTEFDFRYSNRAKLGIDDATRADTALKGIRGKYLMYRRPSLAA
jgi:hypothetical protein